MKKRNTRGFLRLLQVLAPDEQGFYDEGMGETNEKIDKLKASCRTANAVPRPLIDGIFRLIKMPVSLHG